MQFKLTSEFPPLKDTPLLVWMEPNHWDHDDDCDEDPAAYPQVVYWNADKYMWADSFSTQPIIGMFTHWTEIDVPVAEPAEPAPADDTPPS